MPCSPLTGATDAADATLQIAPANAAIERTVMNHRRILMRFPYSRIGLSSPEAITMQSSAIASIARYAARTRFRLYSSAAPGTLDTILIRVRPTKGLHDWQALEYLVVGGAIF